MQQPTGPVRPPPPAPDHQATGPAPSGSQTAPLHPPARQSAAPTTGSARPGGHTYEQRRPLRHYGRGYTDRAPSLVPGAEEPGPASDPPSPAASGVGQQEPSDASYTPGRRVLRVLPLGVGMLLIGLGLGFFGLRLRRR